MRGGLKGTEQCSQCDQAREVFHCGVERERDSPQDDISAEPLGDWDPLDDVVFRILNNQDNDVDDCGEP